MDPSFKNAEKVVISQTLTNRLQKDTIQMLTSKNFRKTNYKGEAQINRKYIENEIREFMNESKEINIEGKTKEIWSKNKSLQLHRSKKTKKVKRLLMMERRNG